MSAKHSQYVACSVADPALMTPVYYALKQLRVAKFMAEQPTARVSYVGDDGFRRHAVNGERTVTIMLEGFSDASAGENLLKNGSLQGLKRSFRFDTAQNERLSGEFFVTRYSQEANGDVLEMIRVELRSHGAITLAAL